MLHQLAEYAESAGIVSEPGFAAKKVHWAVNVTAEGKFLALESLLDCNVAREYVRCPNLLQPELLGGGSDHPRSHYLVESAELLLRHSKKEETNPKKIERNRRKRNFFCDLLDQSSSSSQELSWLRAAWLFLSSDEETDRARHEFASNKGLPTDSVVVTVNSRNPLDTELWHDWWRSYRRSLAKVPTASTKKGGKGVANALARDLLSGELVEPISTHPKVKGLKPIGGLATGDALISFDKNAFQSYGLEQSQNAALSAESASCYVAALNHLVDRGHRLGNTQICYWYSTLKQQDLFSMLLDPDACKAADSSDVNSLIQAIRSGTIPTKVLDRFYYLTVSGCSGRVMVRDWCEGSFEKLELAVTQWYADLAIVRRDGQGLAKPPKFYSVLACLFRDAKELPSPLAQDMFRRAVNASPLPANILALAVNRIRSDLVSSSQPGFNHARMGLIRAYHNRKNGDYLVETHLSKEHPEPAYHCGRLLAVLAQLQTAALGDVGAGVVQRFYAATSQTPALTFGRLLANAQNHLSKLGGGLAFLYNNAIADVMGRIDGGFPQTLTLEKQSLFALGYYQQMAELSRERTERRTTKQNHTELEQKNEGEATNEPH